MLRTIVLMSVTTCMPKPSGPRWVMRRARRWSLKRTSSSPSTELRARAGAAVKLRSIFMQKLNVNQEVNAILLQVIIICKREDIVSRIAQNLLWKPMEMSKVTQKQKGTRSLPLAASHLLAPTEVIGKVPVFARTV